MHHSLHHPFSPGISDHWRGAGKTHALNATKSNRGGPVKHGPSSSAAAAGTCVRAESARPQWPAHPSTT
ncbi:hypothetical protein TVNIR_0129 [Thioalkalivibrio nitratireducens DSM 14787]|uniref:Uncharacterized protein n=1 Tax=Thioalkalivibrio nitratireducens (strain DSM 14787 / UNIQEM 213 / ALEN2) TaxID=1255043 RepID=L0DS59_THIND|nr:hypothetical protein TVNIR_0129 [Thioalkalivibrio nitratireducens DSM 14787]